MTHISDCDDKEFAVAECPQYLLRLDLACGMAKKEGFQGIDISNNSKADLLHDLNTYPYPFKDDSVFDINCSHFVEHVKDLKQFIEECYRILVPGGHIYITAPYYTSIRAIQDYTHLRSICEFTFDYFSDDKLREMNILEMYKSKANFKVISKRYIFDNEWETRAQEAREFAMKHYINTVLDIEIILRKV